MEEEEEEDDDYDDIYLKIFGQLLLIFKYNSFCDYLVLEDGGTKTQRNVGALLIER
jgi:hypothetical protein